MTLSVSASQPMTDLATKIEAAQPGQERELLLELLGVIQPKTPRHHDDTHWEWWEFDARFRKMLDAEAWLSAVEMLVPEGWQEWQVGRQPWKGCNGLAYVLDRGSMRDPLLVHAATPALALAAAIARSICQD